MYDTKLELTQKLINAGLLDVAHEYCTKIGLTPNDVQLWCSILPYLPAENVVGANLNYPLWAPYQVNNNNISGELPHSPGILMNTE